MAVTQTIKTRLQLDGEAEHRAQMKSINAEYRALASELKLVESQFKGQANSMEALTGKGRALDAMYKSQTEKVNALVTALSNAVTAEDNYAAEAERQRGILLTLAETREELAEAGQLTAKHEEQYAAAVEGANQALAQAEKYQELAGNKVEAYKKQVTDAQISLNNLSSDIRDNNKYLDEAQNSSDGAATSIDEYGKKVKTASQSTQESIEAIEGSAQAIEESTQAIEESTQGMDALAGALAAAGIVAAIKQIADALHSAVDASVEFESAITGVYKTVDGTPEQLQAISDGIKQLSTVIPASTTELAAVAEAAGQLGIATEDILDFTSVMTSLGVATNLSATEAASQLAKFANITKMSAADYERLGSVVVALGNNFATTEADIVNMGMGLAAAGKQAGMSESDIMAIAAALSSLGLESAAGGSAFSKAIVQMQVAVEKGSDKLKDFAEIAGMTGQEFAKAFGEDAVGALSAFIAGLSDTERLGASATVLLTDMGITELRMSDALKRAAESGDLFNNALALGNAAWAENTALANEAALRYGTTESKFQLLENSVNLVKVAIGDQLTPALGRLAETGADVAQWAAEFISENEGIVPAVTAVTIGLGTLTVGVTAFTAAANVLPDLIAAISRTMAANPAALFAIALAAVTSAVIAFAVTLDPDPVREHSRALAESRAEYEKLQEAISNRGVDRETLIDTLMQLLPEAESNSVAMAGLLSVIEQLNAAMPGLGLAYDEATNSLNMSAEAIENFGSKADRMDSQIARGERYAQVTIEIKRAQEERAEAEKALTEAQGEGLSTSDMWLAAMSGMTEIIDAGGVAALGLADKIAVLTEREAELTEESKRLISGAEELASKVKETAMKAAEQETAISELADTYGVSADKMMDAFKASGMEFDEWIAQQKNGFEAAKQVAQEYADALKKNTDDVINGFQALKTDIGTSLSEATTNLENNATATARYTELMAGHIAALSEDGTHSYGELSANAIEYIRSLGTGGNQILEEMANAAPETIERFNAAIESGMIAATDKTDMELGKLPQTAEKAITDAGAAIEGNTALETATSNVVQGATTAAKQKVPEFTDIGHQIAAGMAQGVISGGGMLANAVRNIIEQALAAGKSAASIHSPSRLFRDEIGTPITAGVAEGITAGSGMVDDAMRKLANNGLDKMKAQIGAMIPSVLEAFESFDNEMERQREAAIDTMRETATSQFEYIFPTLNDFEATKKEFDRALAMDVIDKERYYQLLGEARDRYYKPDADEYKKITQDIYKYEKDALEKSIDEREKAEKKAESDREKAEKERIQALKKAHDDEKAELDHQRAMDLIDEADYWDARMRLREKYFTGEAELQDEALKIERENERALKKIREDAEKEFESAAKDRLKDYEQQLKDQSALIEAELSAIQKAYDDVVNKQNSMRSQLEDYGEMVRKRTISWNDGSKSEWFELSDINKQIKELENYERVLNELRERGADQSIITQIAAMGVDDGIQTGELLLKQTDKQFDEYNRLTREKQETAARIAEEFYAEELAALETNYNDKLTEGLQSLQDTAFTSGENLVSGLISGMEHKEDELREKIAEINALVSGDLGGGNALTARAQTVQLSDYIDLSSSIPVMPAIQQRQNNDERDTMLVNALNTIAAGLRNTPMPEPIVDVIIDGTSVARTLIPYMRIEDARSPAISRDF